MITIDFIPSWDVEDEHISDLIKNEISLIVGEPSNIFETDNDGEINILMSYPELTFNDILWGELQEFGVSNMVYVIVYEHESKTRKGFWYDEDQEWVEQDMNEEDFRSTVESYEKNMY